MDGPHLRPVPQRFALLGGHAEHGARDVRAAADVFNGEIDLADTVHCRTWRSSWRKSARADVNSYIIAELDGPYTRYQEVTLESEWRGADAFVRGSYTWSHYYGNFDQDNSTTANDANIFVGSSFIADGAGRQLWDLRDGDLRGDRRHMFKLYGYHIVPGVER